jgi:hypothetical protein
VTNRDVTVADREGSAGDVLGEVRAAAEAALEAKAGDTGDPAAAVRLTVAAKAALDHGL